MSTSTIDPSEIAHFSRMAESWWDASGPFKPLHALNPLRVEYIRDQIIKWRENMHPSPTPHHPPLSGLRLLDIGCGGGLIAEPMARLGADVTGIDAAEKNIAVATLHAAQAGLEIDYRCTTAEEMLTDHNTSATRHPPSATYDIVLALEIIEHVADVDAFVAACLKLAKPGGLVIFSTLNRTPKAYALAIIGAEYIMRWLPKGTHHWHKFLRPSELAAHIRRHGGQVKALMGMRYNPLTRAWALAEKDVSVNYLVIAEGAE